VIDPAEANIASRDTSEMQTRFPCENMSRPAARGFLDEEGIAQGRSPVLRNTRHNVTVVRFNDDDRSDWSRPSSSLLALCTA